MKKRRKLFLLTIATCLLVTAALFISDRYSEVSQNSPCYCNGENMCFISYINKTIFGKGVPFNCSSEEFIRAYELRDDSPVAEIQTFEDDEVVFVTYASTDHFYETRNAVHKIRQLVTNKIAFYDVGLKPDQEGEMKEICNLEYHKIHFKNFPSYMSELKKYYFKAIIAADAFYRYPVYWVVDSSVQFYSMLNLAKYYEFVKSNNEEQFMLRHPTNHSMFYATSPGTYSYFPTSTELTKNMVMYESGLQFVRRGSFSREIVKWFVLCALEPDCWDPPSSKLKCNHVNETPEEEYGDCHRFDQSVLDLILTNHLEKQGVRRDRVDEWSSFLFVNRGEVKISQDGPPLCYQN